MFCWESKRHYSLILKKPFSCGRWGNLSRLISWRQDGTVCGPVKPEAASAQRLEHKCEGWTLAGLVSYFLRNVKFPGFRNSNDDGHLCTPHLILSYKGLFSISFYMRRWEQDGKNINYMARFFQKQSWHEHSTGWSKVNDIK